MKGRNVCQQDYVLAGIRVVFSCFCLWAHFFFPPKSWNYVLLDMLCTGGGRLLSNCVVANQLVVQCCNTLVTQKSDFSCIFVHWYKDQILNAFSGQAIYIKLSILNVYFLSPPPSPSTLSHWRLVVTSFSYDDFHSIEHSLVLVRRMTIFWFLGL